MDCFCGNARVRVALACMVLSACSFSGNDSSEEEPVAATEAALSVAPEATCTSDSHNGHTYWFCNTLRTWTDARSKCLSVGFDLAAVESSSENQYLLGKLPGNTWVGASDAAVEGAWTWVATGQQFWQGAANGSPVNGAYKNWQPGQPDNLYNQDCSIFWGGLGLGFWSDESCSTPAVYVCEGDLCPSDPNKTDPGQCGCGVPDTDSDGDGTADCLDQCPFDPNQTTPGQCGCVGETNLKAAGTPCSDGLCSENDECDGQGSCGSPTQCSPSPDCVVKVYEDHAYSFCPTDSNWQTARTTCTALPGTDLVRIDSAAEDAFIFAKLVAPAWIGANDSAAESHWVWSDDGSQFWSGLWNGAPVGGLYSNWDFFQPDDLFFHEDCGVHKKYVNAWIDEDCSEHYDFVCEAEDLCPLDPAKRWPGICGCGTADTDSDGDGTADCNDPCPLDPNKVDPGQCGCGHADTDSDGDGTADCIDGCPSDPGKIGPGQCGCGHPDTDTDADGTADCIDGCPLDPGKVAAGTCGCGVPDTDSDGDGTPDCVDGCPSDAMKTLPGTCGCGIPDVDSDADGRLDCKDPHPFLADTFGDDSCTYPGPGCSPCAAHVIQSFHDDWVLGSGPRLTADINYTSHGTEVLPPYGVELTSFRPDANHLEGIGRLAGVQALGSNNWFVMSRAHPGEIGGAGFFLVSLLDIPDNGGEALNPFNTLFDSEFYSGSNGSPPPGRETIYYYPNTRVDHPAGLQVMGHILAIANSCSDTSVCHEAPFVEFHDLSTPGSTSTLLNTLELDGRRGEPDQPSEATSVAIVQLATSNYLVFVNGKDKTNRGWFYRSTTPYIAPDTDWIYLAQYVDPAASVTQCSEGDPFCVDDIYTNPQPTGEYWGQYQNTTLVTECGTGDVYLVGTGNPWLNAGAIIVGSGGSDVLHLFKVEGGGNSITLSRIGDPIYDVVVDDASFGGFCTFRAGATVYVTPSGQMVLYCTTRLSNTGIFSTDDELKMQERN